MSLNSGLLNPCSADLITLLFGKESVVVLNNCTIAMPGSHVIGSIVNSLNTVSELSPELADILREGLKYPEISEKLTELTQEIAKVKNASAKEKPSLIKKVADNLDNIKTISEGIERLKPYAKVLYGGAKLALGIDLPDWP